MEINMIDSNFNTLRDQIRNIEEEITMFSKENNYQPQNQTSMA